MHFFVTAEKPIATALLRLLDLEQQAIDSTREYDRTELLLSRKAPLVSALLRNNDPDNSSLIATGLVSSPCRLA